MAIRFSVVVTSRDVEVSAMNPDEIPVPIRTAIERLQILHRWDKSQRPGMSRDAATRRFLGVLKRQGIKCTRSTLFNWSKRFAKAGIDGLIDGRADKTTTAADSICRMQIAQCADVLRGQQLAMLAMFACEMAGRRRYRTDSTEAGLTPSQSTFEGASKGG